MGIPHTSEEFRDWVTGDIIGESADRYWVGDSPRMSSPDEDASFGFIASEDLIFSAVTVTLSPFPLRGSEVASAQARIDITPPPGSTFEIYITDSGFNFYAYWDETSIMGGWQTFSQRIDAFEGYNASAVSAAAAAGDLILGMYAPTLLVGEGYGFSISWLDLSGRPQPLQWRQRTDELGVSGVRPARHASTFQATNRARGML